MRRLALLAAMLVALQGCSLLQPEERSRVLTGPDGMRVFTPVHEVGGTPMLCALFGLIDPVHGTLNGKQGEREPVWLETEDGRHLSVIWPEGFTARFEPDATLYSDTGAVIANMGEDVELSQTEWTSASGAYDNPYIASGAVFNSCYPFVK